MSPTFIIVIIVGCFLLVLLGKLVIRMFMGRGRGRRGGGRGRRF